MAFATCRACGQAFAKKGMSAQNKQHPRLCYDCVLREFAYHGFHSPQSPCMEKYLCWG